MGGWGRTGFHPNPLSPSSPREGDGEEEEGCSTETKRKKTKRPRRSRRKSPTGPKVLASDKVRPDGMVEGENENLSDLDGDIEEYILNEKEVINY